MSLGKHHLQVTYTPADLAWLRLPRRRLSVQRDGACRVSYDSQRNPMVKTKSVESPAEPGDGLRILASRFRGRGMAKSRYDVWMANLGPSEDLLHAFKKGEIDWKEFARRYKAEQLEPAESDLGNRTIKNHGQKFTLRLLKELAARGDVTVMCVCHEDEQHCHRHLLKRLIEQV